MLSEHPSFKEKKHLGKQSENDHPALRAPLQRRESSGGEMVWNDELDQEIPKGWKVTSFTEEVHLKGGGTPRTEEQAYWDGSIPFFTPKDVSSSFYTIQTEKNITEDGLNNCSSKLYPKNTVFITARGTVGAVSMAGVGMAMNQSCYAVLATKRSNQYYSHQLTIEVLKRLKNEAIGAVFKALVTRDFDGYFVISPDNNTIMTFGKKVQVIYEYILKNQQEAAQLNTLKGLLLANISKQEVLVH